MTFGNGRPIPFSNFLGVIVCFNLRRLWYSGGNRNQVRLRLRRGVPLEGIEFAQEEFSLLVSIGDILRLDGVLLAEVLSKNRWIFLCNMQVHFRSR